MNRKALEVLRAIEARGEWHDTIGWNIGSVQQTMLICESLVSRGFLWKKTRRWGSMLGRYIGVYTLTEQGKDLLAQEAGRDERPSKNDPDAAARRGVIAVQTDR